MGIRERLSGNEAAAYAMRQINPDVVAAFPITPSTEIPQYFSTYVSNGQVDTEFVAVESEHSAMSACIGAEAAGARAMTATSANGLSLMWEMIYIASSLRLPIVALFECKTLTSVIEKMQAFFLRHSAYQSLAGRAWPRTGFHGLRSPFCSSKSFRSWAASSGVSSPG